MGPAPRAKPDIVPLRDHVLIAYSNSDDNVF